MIKNLISIIFPERCISCGKIILSENYFCDDCSEKIHFMYEPICEKCGRTDYYCNCHKFKNPGYDRLITAYHYKESVKGAVKRLKFGNQKKPAQYLADGMLEKIEKHYASLQFDCIVPVPMYKKQLHARGYNQSYLLAELISRELNIPVNTRLLIKSKETEIQHFLPREKRQKNLKEAFCVKGSCKNLKILLVDDIVTTGSTLSECAKTLKKAGASEISGVAAAAVE